MLRTTLSEVLCVCLLLLACVTLRSSAHDGTVHAPEPANNNAMVRKPFRTVCVRPYTGLAVCGTNNSTDFTGYEPEVFKRVASMLYLNRKDEWGPGKWGFKCVVLPSLGDVVELMRNGTCDIIMGGVEQDEVETIPDTKLSYSIYQAGRRIVLYRPPNPYLWAFLEPFSRDVWLLLLGSTVFLAIAVQVLEATWPYCTAPRAHALHDAPVPPPLVVFRLGSGAVQDSPSQPAQPQVHGGGAGAAAARGRTLWDRLSNLQWSTLGLSFLSIHQLSPRSPGARIALLGGAFAAFVVCGMYTSSYAAGLAVGRLKSHVRTMSDLMSLPVGIYADDADRFASYPMSDLHLLQWESSADEEVMIDLLKKGTLAALIIDAPLADYHTAHSCDLYPVGKMELPTNMGFLFPASIPDAYLINFDSQLQALGNNTELAKLDKQFIHVNSECLPPSALGYPQIKLNEIGGLWIILACCIGLGTAWNMLTRSVAQLVRKRYGAPEPSHGSAGPSVAVANCDVPSAKTTPGTLSPVAAKYARMSVETNGQSYTSARSPLAGLSFKHGDLHAPAPATVDEALEDVQARMDQLESVFAQLPEVLTHRMDDRLTALRIQLASIITNRTKRPGSSMRDSMQGEYSGPRTLRSGATDRFGKASHNGAKASHNGATEASNGHGHAHSPSNMQLLNQHRNHNNQAHNNNNNGS